MVKVPRVENAREKLVDIIAYENALIRRPRIIYISINVRCNRRRNEKPIHIIKCALLYIR